MAVQFLNFIPGNHHVCCSKRPFASFGIGVSHFAFPTKTKFQYSIIKAHLRSNRISNLNSASLNEFSVPNSPNDGDDHAGNLLDILNRWLAFLSSVIPGGSWWNLHLHDPDIDSKVIAAEPVTVLDALSRIWALVEDDRWVTYIAVGSLTIAALSEISMPNILANCIFSAQNGEALRFYSNAKLLILLCFTSGICSGLRGGCFGIANTVLLKRLRETLYSSLIFQDISFFDREAVGYLTSRLGADCQRLSHVIGRDLHLILRNLLQGIGALINLLTLSWPLALSTIGICCVLSVIFLVYGQYQKKAAKITQDFTACANEVVQETLSLVRTVRVYGTETKEHARYKQWLDKLAFISMRESAAYGFWNLSFSTLYRSTQILAIILGGMSILTGHASAEQLTKYVLYCEWLIYASWRVADNLSSLLQSVGASEKVFQLMDLLPSDQFSSTGAQLQRLTGNIEFVNVSFYYPSRMSICILEGLNICLQANEAVAIVGLSGSGKSSLVNLLLRLYEPTCGQILLDGLPLRDLDIRWLRSHIGYVGQEPHLFRLDVKSNISYGCSGDIMLEDVERAAKQAYVHGFISSLPSGYETIIDDELLSGGQKQRIAIARAIFRDPAILILDEATSALDAESEYYIQGLLHSFKNDSKAKRTVIFIAHRISTAKAADRIIVMESGRAVEMGNHKELLLQNGLYAKLFRTQTEALV